MYSPRKLPYLSRFSWCFNKKCRCIQLSLVSITAVVYLLVYQTHAVTVICRSIGRANELPIAILKTWYSIDTLAPPEANKNVSTPLWRVPVAKVNSHAVKGALLSYLPEYKSPCWYEGREDMAGLRCLPYFYLAGVAKSGTTTFYRQLIQHPDILPPLTKEPVFWRYPRRHNLDGYLKMFKGANEKIFQNTDRHGYHRKISVDAHSQILTAAYGVFDDENRRLAGAEPNFTLAHTLYALDPHARVIAILRNPTDRLFSHYHFYHERHPLVGDYSPEKFHKLVMMAIQLVSDCLRVRSLRACAFDEKLNANIEQGHTVTLLMGLYLPYIAEWLRVFPRDQLLFINAEEMHQDPTQTVSLVFDFLDVGQPEKKVMDNIAISISRKHALEHRADSHNTSYRQQMWPETRQLLDLFYKPYNVGLAGLMGSDKWLFERN